MGLEAGAIIGIIGLISGAVGTGLSISSANNAAKSQEQLSLLNAQAQTQAARQSGRLQSMQAQVNAALAAKDAAAANAAAQSLEAQASVVGATGRENTRRQRAEFAVFLARQRASIAKSGVVDTTGSPLALLEDTARESQRAAEDTLFDVENQRRSLFADATAQRNTGVAAMIQGLGFRGESAGALGQIGMASAQARLDYLGARMGASAMRNNALASGVSQGGSMLYDVSQMNYFRTPSNSGAGRNPSVPKDYFY
jgi:hypothetical protein